MEVAILTRRALREEREWLDDNQPSIGDLVREVSAKVGENIQVRRFVRYQLGEE